MKGGVIVSQLQVLHLAIAQYDHQYDEQRYIASLRRRGSPLVQLIDAMAAEAA